MGYLPTCVPASREPDKLHRTALGGAIWRSDHDESLEMPMQSADARGEDGRGGHG